MECTQTLECTQDLYDTHTERVCPEQVGFLGICGGKHPILKGPNKIGRDPQTCSIVLNVNSVSRQHAVLNILSSKEFMLMDLDSANKTKHLNKTLQPYIPHPIRDGDTVQFGDIFGVFRLLEENDALPMTQAVDLPMTQPLDIPETPAPCKQVSKLNKVPTTIVPESPDVSDKDDSFTTPTQQKHDRSRLSSGQFIKSFGKSIPIHPINPPKKNVSANVCKDDINVNSSKQTPCIDTPKASESLKTCTNAIDNIHEMNTQAPITAVNNNPNLISDSPLIHSLNTQVPKEHLPQVCKISDQREMQCDIYTANKENDLSIYNADTQPFLYQKDEIIDTKIKETVKIPQNATSNTEQNLIKSDEEIMFDDIEDDCLGDFYSQPLLPQESPMHDIDSKTSSKEETSSRLNNSTGCDDVDILSTQIVEALPVTRKVKVNALKRTNRIRSDSSTDCEDIEFMPTQKIEELPVNNNIIKEKAATIPAQRANRIQSDSSTDCEDMDMIQTQKILDHKGNEELPLEISSKQLEKLPNNVKRDKRDGADEFDDMPTQIIDIDPEKFKKPVFEDIESQIVIIDDNDDNSIHNISFEDQPTQIVEEIAVNNSTAVLTSANIISPFKIPLISPIRVKNKEISGVITPENKSDGIINSNYYNATQDILDDLYTQREGSPILNRMPDNSNCIVKSTVTVDDDVVPCSVEGYEVGPKFPHIDKDLPSTKSYKDKSIQMNAANSTNQEVRHIVGIEFANKVKKNPSDSSSESTPKKVRACMFTDSDLPNSQEIETSRVVRHTKQATESSSESEIEVNSEEQYTPFLHKKKKSKSVAKVDLTKKFDVEKLPERIITRIRKPTAKMEENLQHSKKSSSNILKPQYLTSQEDEINEDIIKENVKRLKTYGRTKNNKEPKNCIKTQGDKIDKPTEGIIETQKNLETIKKKTSQTKIGNNKELEEKIKVKIPRTRKKKSDLKSASKEKSTNSKSREGSPNTKEKKDAQNKKQIDENKSKDNSLHTTSDEQTNSRSTRPRRKQKKAKSHETLSVSPEKDGWKPVDNKRNRSSKTRGKSNEPMPFEVEVRRSKRQGKAKEKKSESQIIQDNSALKKSIIEQSTVYNESSSSAESPKNLKRYLTDDVDMPSPKRTRAFVNNENNSNALSLRATPARTMRTQYVLFTAFPSEEVKQRLEKLGAVIVTDVMQCTVVLTMQIKRTFKLLCAVGLGKPIVGPSWVQACVDTHMVVDPWLYLIKDDQAEKRFQFSLERTLNGKRNFLKGFNISTTPGVQPNGSEMKLIVESSGGSWKEGGSNWICVSCTKDGSLWPQLRKRGASIVSTEFILGGVLKQKIDITSNKFP